MSARFFLIHLIAYISLFSGLSLNLSCSAHQETQTSPTQFLKSSQKQSKMQDFEVHSLKNIELKSEWLKGKKIVLHYFTTWCHPCTDQSVILNQVHNQLLAQGKTIDWAPIHEIAYQLQSKQNQIKKLGIPLKDALALEIQSYLQNQTAEVLILGVCLEKKGCRRLIDFKDVNQVHYGLWVGSEQQRLGYGPFGIIDAVPTTYLINSDGKLHARFQGMLMPSYLIEQIQQMR